MRQRFMGISLEMSPLSNAFQSAVPDATQAWNELVIHQAHFADLSLPDLVMLAAAVHHAGEEGWLVTFQQPSVSAILTFAENRGLRKRVYRVHATRASDPGPDAGRFDGGDRIGRLLELRQESAALLGFADPVAWSLATKMAPERATVLKFLRDLARRVRPAAERELAEVTA